MRHKKIFLILLTVISVSYSESINIRGKVTNTSGKPIVGAIVELLAQKIKDTTESDGSFSIIKKDVSILHKILPQSEKISFERGILELNLTKNSRIEIELVDTKGKLVKRMVSKNIPAGIYRIDITYGFIATAVYFVKVSINFRERTFRYIPLKNKMSISTFSFKYGSEFLPIAATVLDTIKVSASGYISKATALYSYDTTVNFTLDTTGGNLCKGCGKTGYPKSGRATITVDGVQREYLLKLPDNYDPSKPYMLIFCPHWLGGTIDDVVKGTMCGGPYYGLEALAKGKAIFVVPQGLKDGQYTGFSNPNGRDVKFFKAMLDYFNENLCIDQKRIFSTGFSFGGMMSFALGCAMPDVFRAIAPMSGAFYSGCDSTSKGPIAVWQAHGTSDEAVRLSDAKTALKYFLARNGCSNETVPVNPSPCVAYKGCKEGYPVIYCEFQGGHGVQSWAAAAIWEFFSQF
ncbi:MAG: prolyl oligopeptidase family serine peptidase [Chitinispirillaceae bacterium]|nr:prolyl oligopeptidase family serine peptidase [Chitinispirillaceae bacterium]